MRTRPRTVSRPDGECKEQPSPPIRPRPIAPPSGAPPPSPTGPAGNRVFTSPDQPSGSGPSGHGAGTVLSPAVPAVAGQGQDGEEARDEGGGLSDGGDGGRVEGQVIQHGVAP